MGTAQHRKDTMNLPTDLETAHTMIRQLLKQADELQALARIDAVTHIANRRAFDERLNAAFAHARRTSTPLSVAVLDLDDFKRRNDTLGHAAGDACLKSFAAQLVSHSRADDFAARIGGEEFAIILPNTGEMEAANICIRIAAIVRYGCCAGAPLTFSAGVAELDGSAMHPSTVVEHADRAMYLAKNSGKDSVRIHRPTFHRAVVDGNLFQRLTRSRSL
jgi:diguanylate cyclase (GGDEF)-like protein